MKYVVLVANTGGIVRGHGMSKDLASRMAREMSKHDGGRFAVYGMVNERPKDYAGAWVRGKKIREV